MHSHLIPRLVALAVVIFSGFSFGLGRASGSAAFDLSLDPEPPLMTPSPDIILVPGTVQAGEELAGAARMALAQSRSALPPARHYAISALQQEGNWYFVSAVGLAESDAGADWRLEDALWFGLVLLHHGDAGWRGAAEGTESFSRLLATVPDSILSPAARVNMDPASRPVVTGAGYRFPWPAGTAMEYGPRGLHGADFEGWGGISGWKAVDMCSDGDVSAGHAPNRLLAAASGTITAVCNDGTSVAIRLGDMLYAHFLNNANLRTGKTFAAGEELGQLRPGNFSANCGWASQGTNWFHVHWGFPATNLQVEDWTLSMADGLWRRGSETRGIYAWFEAGETGDSIPPDGDYTAPSPGEVVANLVRLEGWGQDAGSGLQRAHFTARWGGEWHQVGPDFVSSPFAYDWDLCEPEVPDGDIELGLDLWDNAGNAAYSPQGTRHITKRYACNAPPAPPALSSPAYRSLQAPGAAVMLSWQPSPRATEYLAEWWGGPLGTAQVCDWSAATSCSTGQITAGYVYYWRAKARNGVGEGDWSSTWAFTVQPLEVTETLTLSSQQSPAGQPVTAHFKLKNATSRALTLQRLTVAAYGPDCAIWECSDWVNFPHEVGITLQPGQAYEYSRQRTLTLPGAYSVELAYQDVDGIWRTGLAGSARLTLNVTPGIALMEDVSLAPSQPQASQWVTFTFKARNSGPRDLPPLRLGIAARGPGCVDLACSGTLDLPPMDETVLSAGQELAYRVRWAFPEAGSGYLAEAVVIDEDGSRLAVAGSRPVPFIVAPRLDANRTYLPLVRQVSPGP